MQPQFECRRMEGLGERIIRERRMIADARETAEKLRKEAARLDGEADAKERVLELARFDSAD